MDDLKRIEGKTIKSFEENFDGINSYIIIKFEEGGKINISSFPHDDGVGQLDLFGLEDKEKYIGKRIHSVKEDFDGESDHLIFKFKDGTEFTVTSFSSGEDGTAGLDVTVYSTENLVVESLDKLIENTYSDARHGQYPMYKPQYENGETIERQSTEIMLELESWLAKQQIYDEQEKLEEIESWLDLNLEGESEKLIDAVKNLVSEKYDIFLGY